MDEAALFELAFGFLAAADFAAEEADEPAFRFDPWPTPSFSPMVDGIASRNISLARLAAFPKVVPIVLATSVNAFSLNFPFCSSAISIS
ncbi:MAG: hypothetical protein JOZ10_13995 [Acidobacteria bacterium]|nr:hypothetical protein [Acidobacteriota bacterium]MBV9146914.1 hypothetical protein [Acidobacteriota bacterium]MBV9437175.1 hypothetical protein [Acidobacteriota bacterium]